MARKRRKRALKIRKSKRPKKRRKLQPYVTLNYNEKRMTKLKKRAFLKKKKTN
jgi:hypothetical protein